MCRLTAIVLFLALSYATCSIINDRGTKDVPLPDAEIEDNSIAVPEVPEVPEVLPIDGITQFSATDNAKCAKVGEFCINHKDCCSNSCLGFMRRCVS
uniref:WAP domain-containing protein n=1 Tax=Heliothis virescens TaxID=7102 RepID=A0A2A4J5T4_HELVI